MIKFAAKLLAVLMIFAIAGCGTNDDEMTTDLSNEALIDIMAHSSYLSMELQEDYQVDPEGTIDEFQFRMEEVADSHGVTLQQLETNPAYEEQWNTIMTDPDLQQQFHGRINDLQEN